MDTENRRIVSKMKIVSIVGTRPNFMKIAPVVDELKKRDNVQHILLHTGQHYDVQMSKLFFEDLQLPRPDEHLAIQTNLSGDKQRQFLQDSIGAALERQKPDLVIVVGDVNSTLAGARAAKKLGIKIAHVESGLRSFDKTMPEEFNRVETDKISDFLFTTERSGNENLIKEGISEDKIFFVGNVMIDTLLRHKDKAKTSQILDKLKLEKNSYSTLTLHRPSNVDTEEGLENILSILESIQEKIKIVFPMHPRTRDNVEKFNLGEKIKSMNNLIIINPIGYLDFLWLMTNSKLVLTDSGGIQEETTVLGVPCITLRVNTERPVTAEQGTNLLVSTDKDKIVEKSLEVIDGRIKIKKSTPELWDGKAAERIVKILLK